MSFPVIKIKSDAAGAADTNSGAGPGDGTTAGSPIAIATAAVFAGVGAIGLYGISNLDGVAVNIHTIQIDNTTAGYSALKAITVVRTTEDTGTCDVDSDGTTVTIDPMPSGLSSGFPIKIGSQYSYIASGIDATRVSLGVAVTGSQTGVAYTIPRCVWTDGTNLQTGIYSAVIGGYKASIFGPLTLKIIDGGASGVFDGRDGWVIDCLTNEARTYTASINWRLVATNSAAGRKILFRGRGRTDRTVWTFTRTGGASSPFSATTDQNGVIFNDFDFVSNAAGQALLSGNSSRADMVNCRLLPGSAPWAKVNDRYYGTYIDCYFEQTTGVSLFARMINCDLIIKNTSNINMTASNGFYFRCRFRGNQNSTPTALVMGDTSSIQNCDFVDMRLIISSANLRPVANCSFTFTTAYAGYAITWLSTSFGQWMFAGGTLPHNNYHNCTDLMDPALDPYWAAQPGKTNINPAYTNIDAGDWRSSALAGQGSSEKLPGADIALQNPIGSVFLPAGSGGSGNIIIIED